MDPVTAIGLASGILSFLNFSTSLVQGAISIHDSLDGDLEQNRSLELVVGEMKQLSTLLLSPDDSTLVGPEKGLCGLASECRALSSKLLELLGKIKPKDSSSKTQSLWSALKNKMYEKEKIELEQRLDYCRGGLELHLTFLTSRETRAQLTLLIERAQEDASKLQKVQETMDQLSRGVELASISEAAKAQIRQLVQVQEDVLCRIAQSQILKGLAFSDMHSRYDMVEEAHASTFAWIFGDEHKTRPESECSSDEGTDDGDYSVAEDDSHPEDGQESHRTVEEDSDARSSDGESKADSATKPADDSEPENKREIADKFKTWLACGSGIFHISGKLGCGKSTLMKFLCEHPGTKAELSKWAGSELQKSLFGLLRGLLHEVLQTCPDLIPAVLPDHWKKTRETPWMAQVKSYLSEKDVRAALARLARKQSLQNNRCFIFFIDGLDEYNETPQQDHKAVLDLLCGWVKASPGSMKLCVSSREDNIFMNNFSAEQRLRLHDLTRRDMQSYVREKLTDLPEGEEREHLILEIPEKAQGIFLWVTLVVRSIREELENGASMEALGALLDSFPDELEALFEHIIRSFRSTRERKKAFQTFAMLSLSNQYSVGFSLFAYSFYESYEADKQFAIRENFPDTITVDGPAVSKRLERARKYLNGNSKGLLETRSAPSPQGLSSTFSKSGDHIDYSHRSIPEFLQRPAIKAEMASHIEGFFPAEVLSELVLAEIRLSRHIWTNRDFVITPLIGLRVGEHLDQPPYTFLESLVASYLGIVGDSVVEDEAIEDGGTYLVPIYRGTRQITAEKEVDPPRHTDSRRLTHHLFHPLLATALAGHFEYFKWKLDREPDLLRRPSHVTLAAYTAMLADNYTSWKIVDYFLQNSYLTVLTRSDLRCGRIPPHRHELPIWHHYLVSEFVDHYIWDESEDRLLRSRARFSHIAECFLDRGADPHFLATVTIPERPRRKTSSWFTDYRCVLEVGLERKSIVIAEGGSSKSTAWDLLRLDGFSPEDACDVADLNSPKTRSLSLSTWVEYVDPPNKERLLWLIERNKQRLKSPDAPAPSGMTAEEPTTGLESKGKMSENQGLSAWYRFAFILDVEISQITICIESQAPANRETVGNEGGERL
ncbi:hypothetical protein B0T22DRAFT_536141 [Podospora appendiculata]|uniref:NACHT domain-containing protein n=1 Tax=Podospora appendiculata TaxID=314037 RepID=A0AAE1CD19_9PEZI|nr:hypothetical protein B0T22DRAFT_536141 [Podospora appendiculata]